MECKDCGTVRQADIGFADPRFTYTRDLGRYVLELAKHVTTADVSRYLALIWDIIKSIQKRYLHSKYGKVNLKELKQIAIDEIYVGKDHYLTIVLECCERCGGFCR